MSNLTPPQVPQQQGMSGGQAFKIGCMVALGIFAAIFFVTCALPAACVMGGAGTIAAVGSAVETAETVSTPRSNQEETKNPDATQTSLTMEQARQMYQAAMDEGLIISYDQPNQTITVNETNWAIADQVVKDGIVASSRTLVGYGNNNVAFKIVGNATQKVLVQFEPATGARFF